MVCTHGDFQPAVAFLLYDNRSGSTLLSSLLSQFEGVHVSPETDIVFQVLEFSPEIALVNTASLIDHLYLRTRFPELGIDRRMVQQEIATLGPEALRRDILTVLFGLIFADAPHGAVRVLKGPRTQYHLRAIAAAFPAARLIHLVRDGRAVFSSKRRTPSGRSVRENGSAVMDANLVRAATNWRRKIEIVEGHGELPVLTIKYEDLIGVTDPVLNSVLEFLGVSAAGRRRRAAPAEFRNKIDRSYAERLHANVGTSPLPDRIDAWRSDLSPGEALLFEWLAGDALRRYGYAVDSGPEPNLRVFTSALARWVGYHVHRVAHQAFVLVQDGLSGSVRARVRGWLVKVQAERAARTR